MNTDKLVKTLYWVFIIGERKFAIVAVGCKIVGFLLHLNLEKTVKSVYYGFLRARLSQILSVLLTIFDKMTPLPYNKFCYPIC